ncbi:hypothetical protein K502DRAFT_207380 [Neoconidiobolus thromboides FSU 785]|nr:hypothetical protein K502DRAFT_207380 [Neoconidiobolus thromboides FSU 785]
MGAVKRYEYPKHVWSPAGGWWAHPKQWRRNTAIVMAGMTAFIGVVWNFSASREWRHYPPKRWIPSMLWASQFNVSFIVIFIIQLIFLNRILTGNLHLNILNKY